MDKFTAYDILYSMIEDAADDAGINYSIENDGIGAYEYWGYKGYDHGVDYILIEEPSVIKINKPHWSNRFLKFIIGDIIDEDDRFIGEIHNEYDYTGKVKGYIDNYVIKQDSIIFTIVWDDGNII